MQIISGNNRFDVEVNLVGSKSESNRALMICHYAGFEPKIRNISESDDTKLLQEILRNISVDTGGDEIKTIDCANAGTVFRFLVTALAVKSGDWILTGTDRLLQRPVGDLVDALRNIGADIEYLGKDGFPPLKIHGKNIIEKNNHAFSQVSVNISRSSQFASSILLALPVFNSIGTQNFSSLRLDGDLTSVPYIDMTIDAMRKYGAKIQRNGRDVFIQLSDYQNVEYVVESDWSAASYWYEIVAFSENGRAVLRNLNINSQQGDKVVSEIFENIGVKTSIENNSIIIKNNSVIIENNMEKCGFQTSGRFVDESGTFPETSLQFDFTNTPDLFPAIAATCAGLQLEGRFTGLRNLFHKESDRVAAMMTELSKIGVKFEYYDNNLLIINKLEKLPRFSESNPVVFDSHNDHRIAMALAPLAMKIGAVEITNPDVVSKSYPNYWKEIQTIF